MVGGDVSFYLKFALKVTHPPLKSADFDQYLLITSQPKELAKNVQLSRRGSRQRAFQRAVDEVCTLPLSPPEDGSKSELIVFANKNKFKSLKVSLFENFQQSCSRTRAGND